MLRKACAMLALVACGGTFSVGTNDSGLTLDAGTQQQADKIDIIFVVDNSSSMGTKQDILRNAASDFLYRLIVPECVSDDGKYKAPRVGLKCPPGYVDQVKPITDLHVGVITSSLGGGGSVDQCDSMATIEIGPSKVKFNRHNDDRGHLINRKKPDWNNPPPNGVEDPIPGALSSNYLAWLPSGGPPLPPVKAYNDLVEFYPDFSDLVYGAEEFGCGLEAQLEAFYRFLIQPDPWDRIELDTSQNPAAAMLVGIDPYILQQRRDFLRPDSAVAVIVVTDEEDSWSDPMWLNGRGWVTRSTTQQFSANGTLPRGTTPCGQPVDPNNVATTGPNDPKCLWCGLSSVSDPNCLLGSDGKGLYGPTEDGINVRYTDDMKRRYGMNPQFPIERYVDGLTSPMVPDKKGEHTDANGKAMPYYQSNNKNCVNPLFAKNLPSDPQADLCNLEPGPRNSSLVFFGIIGGVPWQLLTDDPKKGGTFKNTLDDADWVRILGKDPATYQNEGIDPHMLESIKPRQTLPCMPSAPSNCDAFNGREYDTATTGSKIDLQYACVFDLVTPIDCTKDPDKISCDCVAGYNGPLCAPNPSDNMNMTLQTRSKAYPTIRELRVAKALGTRAVVGSICPRTLNTGEDDYGYRPALRALVEHLRVALK